MAAIPAAQLFITSNGLLLMHLQNLRFVCHPFLHNKTHTKVRASAPQHTKSEKFSLVCASVQKPSNGLLHEWEKATGCSHGGIQASRNRGAIFCTQARAGVSKRKGIDACLRCLPDIHSIHPPSLLHNSSIWQVKQNRHLLENACDLCAIGL